MEKYIKGVYRKSIFQSDSGYTIGLFKVKETNIQEWENYVNKTITFTGYFHELNDIDTYLFYGDMIEHERYGEQFQVSAYTRVLPEENASIIEFLSSDLFKGIGKTKIKKIVDYLGKDTLSVILDNPNNLLLISGITQKNIDLLHEKLLEYESSYQLILYLTELGFSSKDSMMLYKKYKAKTMDIIKNNVYQSWYDFKDLTFKKIDHIATGKLEIPLDDTRRLSAGIIYILEEVCNVTGNTYLLKEELPHLILRALNINITLENLEDVLIHLEKDGKIKKLEQRIYLFTLYQAEKNIKERFLLLNKRKEQNEENTIVEKISMLEKLLQIEYNKSQKEAIKQAHLNDFLIITGGPGTGKTTIIKAIIELYRLIHGFSANQMREKLMLLAPTGRASKRMSEVAALPAQTIHRFLKWNKDTNTFAINEYNKSDVEFVIIDEASMIDTYLLDSLLKGLSIHCKIVLVGDYHQLPSVGPGQILKDCIESEMLNIIVLNELYRQKSDSNILTLAYDIQKGSLQEDIFNQEDDLTFIHAEGNETLTYLKKLATLYQDIDYKKIQILAPMYKGMVGIDEINKQLQQIFNPKTVKKKELKVGDIIYRENDKVIQLTNMPDDNVFNGDIGVITKIENGTKREIYIDFDGNVVRYTPSNFVNFKHGFAISIHKSQGSEFSIVIIPILKNYGKMLYRKLIYTAVTRCKERLILVGEEKALNFAVNNNQEDTRRTSLKEMLKIV